MKQIFLFLVAAVTLPGQCQQKFSLASLGRSSVIDNRTSKCTEWSLSFSSTAPATTLTLQSAESAAGPWSTFAGTSEVSAATGTIIAHGYADFVSVVRGSGGGSSIGSLVGVSTTTVAKNLVVGTPSNVPGGMPAGSINFRGNLYQNGVLFTAGLGGEPGPGGTSDHAMLVHLDYASSGHTGFQPALPSGSPGQFLRYDKTFVAITTTLVPEGTNPYFNNSRARAALSSDAPISYDPITGKISCPTCGTVSGVPSVFGRTGAVIAQSGDYSGFYAPLGHGSAHNPTGGTDPVTVTKNDVGLNNVDNTSDASKPVSTSQAAALALKAPLASPAFSGTVDSHGASKTLPNRTGTGSPVGRDACATAGETYFQTNAVAGSNTFACTSPGTPGTWTLQAGSIGNRIESLALPVAVCGGSVNGATGFSTPANNSPVPDCIVGANSVLTGSVRFPAGATTSMQHQVLLPYNLDCSSAMDLVLTWRAAAITGSATWQVQTQFVASGVVIDGAAFNAASAVAHAPQGTTLQIRMDTITGITKTGCAAGSQMLLMLSRLGTGADTMTGDAELIGAQLRYSRAY